MKINEHKGVTFCTFENIEKLGFISHCFSTKLGGVSEKEFASLNLSFTRGDEKEKVAENFKRLCSACHMDFEKMVSSKQVHGKEIKVVKEIDAGNAIEGFDGFVTNEKALLVTFHADCVPLFFVDTKNKAIGLVHSGWQGTQKKIAVEAIKKMEEVFGTNPKDIVAAIGPSIGSCCFQVGKEVVEAFEEAMEFANEYIVKDDSAIGKYKIDLWGINKRLMLSCGVLEENIEVTNKCTMCEEKLFFSHRRQGEQRGSMAAFMCLKA